MGTKPLYIISSERSGSNLLRRRITQNQEYYYGPPAPHFLKYLYFQEPYYGDLSENKNFRQLIADAYDLFSVHFAPWEVKASIDETLSKFGNRKRGAIHLSDYLFQQYTEQNGYSSYICKDNFLYEFALDIADEIPDAKFIFLYRDPRDVVLSQLKRPLASKSLISQARLWEYEQIRSIQVANKLQQKGRCITLSYESLITDEDSELERVCEFLLIDKIQQARDSKDIIIDSVHDWANLDKPTDTNNHGKYNSELSTRQVGLIEVICNSPMTHLGYQPTTSRTKPPTVLEAMLYIFIWLTSRMKARLSSKQPSSVLNRMSVIRKMQLNYRNAGWHL